MSKTVLISAGHSNKDPGAVNGKRKEADIVLDMRNMVSVYLRQAGVSFKEDGKYGENLPLNQAISLAKTVDIAVEFHTNAAASKQATGVEALSNLRHKGLSQRLCNAVHKAMGIPLRGDKGWKPEYSGQHSRLGFISTGDGIILELFFISNDAELAKWDSVKWLVAKAVAEVLIEEVKK